MIPIYRPQTNYTSSLIYICTYPCLVHFLFQNHLGQNEFLPSKLGPLPPFCHVFFYSSGLKLHLRNTRKPGTIIKNLNSYSRHIKKKTINIVVLNPGPNLRFLRGRSDISFHERVGRSGQFPFPFRLQCFREHH